VINHDVVWLDVAVHDPVLVTKVEGFQELKQVVPHVHVGKRREHDLEVDVVDVLEDERGCPGHGVLHHVEQPDDVGSATQVLEHLDLALDFRLLHRFQDLDHTL
jgi:hypothetical protein